MCPYHVVLRVMVLSLKHNNYAAVFMLRICSATVSYHFHLMRYQSLTSLAEVNYQHVTNTLPISHWVVSFTEGEASNR